MTPLGSGGYGGEHQLLENGHIAIYAEVRYVISGVPYSLCTQLRRE